MAILRTKEDHDAEIARRAERMRRPGESLDAAIRRFYRTPAGLELLAARDCAPREAEAAKQDGRGTMQTKSQITTNMKQLAERQRRPGETAEKAYARFLDTDDGGRLYGEYLRAPADFVEREPEAPQAFQMGELESAVWSEIQREARSFAEAKGIGFSQAVAKVLDEKPQLYTLYRRAQMMDRRKGY